MDKISKMINNVTLILYYSQLFMKVYQPNSVKTNSKIRHFNNTTISEDGMFAIKFQTKELRINLSASE